MRNSAPSALALLRDSVMVSRLDNETHAPVREPPTPNRQGASAMRIVKQTSWALALCVLGGALSSVANAQNEQATRMKTALASPDRPAADKTRDDARKPIETVQFAGIKTGQTVLEVIAAGGWFTEVLSAAVGPTGKVYAQNPMFFTTRPGFAEAEKARNDRLKNVTPIHGDLPDPNLTGKADVALTALNLHDIYNM